MPGPTVRSPIGPNRPVKKSGGLFGDIGHVISGTAKGLYHGITGLPTGAYMTGRAVAHDISQGIEKHPINAFNPEAYLQSLATGRTGSIAKNVAKQEYSSYRHFGKGGDISGPILDASAVLTGGSSLAARTGKAISEVSKAAEAERAAKAAELVTKDTAVMMAKGGGHVPGMGYTEAAKRFRISSSALKTHANKYREGLSEGNMSVGKPVGEQGKYANVTPNQVLKNPKHPLFDFYAERYPDKISSVTRARKAFAQKPIYQRPMLFGKPFDKKRSGMYVPTSPNPVFRQVRKAREITRSQKSATRDVLKEQVRRGILQERINAPKGIVAASKKTSPIQVSTQNPLERVAGVPMAALRMSMWARPRYYLQNIAQTGQMLGTQPVLSARSLKLAKEIHKYDPNLYHANRAITGEAQAGALAAGTSTSRLGNYLAGDRTSQVANELRARGVQGAMGYYANIPESHVRAISVLNELQKHHRNMGNLSALTPQHVEQYLGNLRKQGVLSKEHLPLRRAIEEVGDFSRIYSGRMLKQSRPSEREFMATQLPIFYPMFKALSRYGVRFPSEHAVLSATGLALGKQGKNEQRRLLGRLPFWGQYLVPRDAGDPGAKRSPHEAVFNPANIYNLQPAADIGRQTAELARPGGPNPGISYLQEAGPAPAIAYGLMTGKDIQTGYPIKPFSKGFYKKHPGMNRSLINVPANYAEGLPLSDLEALMTGRSPHVRSYVKGNAKNRILSELIGPAAISRVLKTKETTKQAKRESDYGKTKAPSKKKPYYP